MSKGDRDIINLSEKEYQVIVPDIGRGSFEKSVTIKDQFIDELFVAKRYEFKLPTNYCCLNLPHYLDDIIFDEFNNIIQTVGITAFYKNRVFHYR